MTTPNFKLYVKAGCPWCDSAEAYLRQHGFQYEAVDVRKDAAAFAEHKRVSGQTYAPTLVVGDLVLPDFDTEELEDFLEEHGIKPQALTD
jgi:glutaredoxin 3